MALRHHVTAAGKDPFQTWLDRLKDMRAKVAIQRRTKEASMKAAVSKPAGAKGPARRARPKTAPYRSGELATIESLRRDPVYAAEYLNAVLDDGDQEELLLALRYLANTFGGVPKLAASAKLNATTLYRTLSPKGNPELRSMRALLGAMGMRLAIEPAVRARRSSTALRTARQH